MKFKIPPSLIHQQIRPQEEQAPMNIGTPSLSERLMRALELKGLLPNVLRPTLTPVVIAADMTQPEFRWLSRERTYHCGFKAAAVAANNQIYQAIFLGSTGDSLCIIDSFRLFNEDAAAQLWTWYISNAITGGGNSTRISPLDGRSDGGASVTGPFGTWNAFPQTSVSTFQAVQAPPANAVVFEVGPGQAIEVPGPWILGLFRTNAVSPIALSIHSNAVNVASSLLVRWRERLMPTSEGS